MACVIHLVRGGRTARAELFTRVAVRLYEDDETKMSLWEEVFREAVGARTWRFIKGHLRAQDDSRADPHGDVDSSDEDDAGDNDDDGNDDGIPAPGPPTPPLSMLGRSGYSTDSADERDPDLGAGILDDSSFDFGSADEGEGSDWGEEEEEEEEAEEEEEEGGEDADGVGGDLRRFLDQQPRARHARARGMAANLAQEIRRRIAENARVLAGHVEEEDEESEGGSESEGDGDESESDDVQQSGSGPSLGN